MLRTSVVIPAKDCRYLDGLIRALSNQSKKPDETVIVIKEDEIGRNLHEVETICSRYNLKCTVIGQQSGFFTHALNIGKKTANFDITIFTDSDAIPPSRWVETYAKLYSRLPEKIGGISSRDIYWFEGKATRTPDDMTQSQLFRMLVRPFFQRPIKILRKYRLGLYLSKDMRALSGPFLPSRQCYSLPFRGVNMSFRSSAIENIYFPDFQGIRIAPSNEVYLGLQLILRGQDLIYVPNNPVFHLVHPSLSRQVDTQNLLFEKELMKTEFRRLLASFHINP